MHTTTVFAGIAVGDFDAALAWYERLLGRPADRIPMQHVGEWDLAPNGSLQLVHDADRAGGSLATIVVNDLEAELETLAGRELQPRERTSGEAFATASFVDPEGNMVTLVEVVGAG